MPEERHYNIYGKRRGEKRMKAMGGGSFVSKQFYMDFFTKEKAEELVKHMNQDNPDYIFEIRYNKEYL